MVELTVLWQGENGVFRSLFLCFCVSFRIKSLQYISYLSAIQIAYKLRAKILPGVISLITFLNIGAPWQFLFIIFKMRFYCLVKIKLLIIRNTVKNYTSPMFFEGKYPFWRPKSAIYKSFSWSHFFLRINIFSLP